MILCSITYIVIDYLLVRVVSSKKNVKFSQNFCKYLLTYCDLGHNI